MENINEIVSLIIIGSTVLYRKYLSTAARACKKSNNKKDCINKYRIKGYEAQIKKLRDGIKDCSKSKDSNKCKQIIKNKINKVTKKLLLIKKSDGVNEMTLKDLKLMAGEIIKESNYSISAKKQLLNFVINEASDSQIKSLILDGNIERLDEDAIDIVNKRFKINLENSMKENLTETQEFIEIGRETICDLIETYDYNNEDFEKMIEFVVNEATDYQVLSMLVEGNVPDEIYDPERYSNLTENLNQYAGTNFVPLLSEVSIKDLIDKNAVLKSRLSVLQRNPDNFSPARLKAVKAGITKKLSINNSIINQLKQKGKVATGKSIDAYAMSKPGVKTPSVKPDVGASATDVASRIKQPNASGKPTGIGSMQMKGGGNVGGASATKHAATVTQQATSKAKELAAKGAKFAKSPTGQAIGGLAAAALVTYAAYKIYKNYFSQAARACKGAGDKSACMRQYKNKAVQAQISKLSSGMGSCAKSKDPAKCKAVIQNKIAKLKGKIK